jgi:hypothetical protein
MSAGPPDNGHRSARSARQKSANSGLCRRSPNGKLWNVFMGLHQSGLMLDSRITFSHFLVSSNMNFSKVGGCHQYWIGAKSGPVDVIARMSVLRGEADLA